MANHSPVFQNYVAQQADFNSPYPQGDIAQSQVGLGALPIQQPQVPGGAVPGGAPGGAFQPGGGAIPDPSPVQEISQNPFFQFYNMYKGSSKEKQNTAIARLSQDYNNPLDMGLPYDELTMGAVKKQKDTGQNEPDPSAWKKFLSFVDSNPKFLLDLGAQLLAPRQAGQSQFGAVASALQGATQRLAKRRADNKAGALATRKVNADIASTVADTSKVASEIAVNKSQAVKNLREAYAGKTPAAKVQVLDKLQNSFWNKYGKGDNAVIGSKDDARLIAFDYMEGRDTERLKAFLKFAGDNAFLTGIPTAIADAQAMQQAAPKGIVAGLDAEKAVKKRAKDIEVARKNLLSNPEKLRAYLKQKNPTLPDEAITARMEQILTGKAGVRRKPATKVPQVKGLDAQVKELIKLPGDTKPGGHSPTQQAAHRRQQRALKVEARKLLKKWKSGQTVSKVELKLALRAATTDNQKRSIIRDIRR